MSEKLVIVESPTKARTISKMLSGNCRIMASMGHIRDLPEHSFGVDVKHDFTPLYRENPKSAKLIKDLRAAAQKADSIYLAPDPDREGEAIAWHLKELLQPYFKGQFHRVTFHEITAAAINRAFNAPTDIDMHRVDAQQARRVLDRLVGYLVSPLLWSKIEKGSSAGRVQSVALRLICEREREIIGFMPVEYWNFTVALEAETAAGKKSFVAKLAKIDGEKFQIENAVDADRALAAIRGGGDFKVAAIDFIPKTRKAPPPFTTSTLQQAGNNSFHFAATQTMRLAQQLYEGINIGEGGMTGLITYMRTDSVNIAQEARDACRNFIAGHYGQDYIPPRPNFYKSKAGAQEAHEAVRPTDVTLTPEKIAAFLEPAQLKLYTLIWRRFVASQMAEARQRQTVVETVVPGADGRKYAFRSSALVTEFAGFTKVFDAGATAEDDEEQPAETLKQLRQGQECFLKDAASEQKFTEPPPRFTEAMLIKELEANGVGRPSTYATILHTIQLRRYVERDKGRLCPTELGLKVNDFLVATLPALFEVDFTSKMESSLDRIEEGKVEWTAMMQDFYAKLSQWLDVAKNIGAPEGDKVRQLFEVMNITNWAPPEKRGKSNFDDHKFFASVREKFAKDGKITARQWQALLNLAAKYAAQLPQLQTAAAALGFSDALNQANENVKAAAVRKADSTASKEQAGQYARIFNSFSGVQWDAPQKKRGRTYDDKKFFDSLRNQAEQGKILSEKQLKAIENMAFKYREVIPDFTGLCALLNVTPESRDAAAPAAAGNEATSLLEALGKVREWAAPTAKGKRVYDDKAFYESLAEQQSKGRQLSPKQLFALKKMASKYSAGSGV